MEHLGLGHDNFRKNYLVPAMNTNTRCHDEHLSLWRTDTRQLTFCPQAPHPRRKNDAAQQGKASTNKIGRMEASEAICPITSGKHPYADAQIPSCLVGGSRRTTSLGGCHPDEQCVECRVQRARERKQMPLHPCKPVGEIEYAGFARTIDDRITCDCISCFPDVTDAECCCAWRFKLD